MFSKDAGSGRIGMAVKGFTLLELMVVLAIASILLSLAAPSFSGVLSNGRRSAAVNELVVALNYARTQAVTTRTTVTICRSANGVSCDTAGGGWQSGWIVFADDDANGLRAGDEAILRQHEAFGGNITLNGNSNLQRRVTFRPLGNTGNNGRLAYCDSRGWTQDARVVIVSTTGRVRALAKDEDPNEPLPGCTP